MCLKNMVSFEDVDEDLEAEVFILFIHHKLPSCNVLGINYHNSHLNHKDKAPKVRLSPHIQLKPRPR